MIQKQNKTKIKIKIKKKIKNQKTPKKEKPCSRHVHAVGFGLR